MKNFTDDKLIGRLVEYSWIVRPVLLIGEEKRPWYFRKPSSSQIEKVLIWIIDYDVFFLDNIIEVFTIHWTLR